MRYTPLCAAVILINCWSTHAFWPFAPKRFTSNSLIGTGSLGLAPDGRVVAFGDLNGDQFMDILMIGPDQQTLTSYIWHHDEFTFERTTSFRHPQKIHNVVPGDFNNDGRLDLLVMSQGQKQEESSMMVYFSDLQNGFEVIPTQVPSSTILQPIVVDANGDMKIDLLGTIPSADKRSPLRLWKNVWNETANSPPLFELSDPMFENGDQAVCTLSQPHSNAFLDLNGDCLADIFLTCDDLNGGGQYFQIWLNAAQDGKGFYLDQTGRLPKGAGQITFADMDRDGTIDIVFPTCDSVDASTGVGKDCMINIAYNKQLPLCITSATGAPTQKKCRSPESLCTPDPTFKFDMKQSDSNDAFVRIPLKSLFPSFPYLLMSDTTHEPPIPLAIRVGDLSLDGFPDLIPIVASPLRGGVLGIGETSHRTPRLLTSVSCARNVPGCNANGQGRRGFQAVNQGSQALQQVTDARGVTVLDLDEDGTLDILVQRTGEQKEGTTLFVHNNFFYDAFFLKAMVLNRPCDGGWCTTRNGTSYQAFGVSSSGASYKYTVQDTSGHRSAAQVAQLPQTSYHSLHTPYAFFGLGRTNNYIENLFVGSTKKQDAFINMEGVIPNSKVVIIPSPQGEKYGWKRELFLRPGAWIPWVTLTVVLATVILAVIVFVLHLNEKREDELERRRASHSINFDAL